MILLSVRIVRFLTGVYNMHGNAFEWCEDVFDEGFYTKPEATETDPICEAGSEDRVFRGGGWDGPVTCCRSAYREWDSPSLRDNSLGFRPAFPVP